MEILPLKKNHAFFNTALAKLQTLLKFVRDNNPPKEFDPNNIVKSDIRIGHLEGKAVKRLVLFLRSTGCLWKTQTGGCTMCGFWAETAQGKKKIETQEFTNQFKNALKELDVKSYPILSLYNAGSFFQEEEIPFSAAENICYLTTKHLPNLKRLMVETRAQYIDIEKLKSIQKILGKKTQLTIGIGLDSQDDTVRRLCIHKEISKHQFEKTIETLNGLGIHSIVNLLVKPPFLTEKEGIDELILSTKYACNVGVREIHYETMTIERGTVVSLLYEMGIYKLPWLWSIIEVLRHVSEYTRPFLTHFVYPADFIAVPNNCRKCSSVIEDTIYNKYCTDFNIEAFSNLQCSCKNEWINELGKNNTSPLENRVYDTVKRVETLLSQTGHKFDNQNKQRGS